MAWTCQENHTVKATNCSWKFCIFFAQFFFFFFYNGTILLRNAKGPKIKTGQRPKHSHNYNSIKQKIQRTKRNSLSGMPFLGKKQPMKDLSRSLKHWQIPSYGSPSKKLTKLWNPQWNQPRSFCYGTLCYLIESITSITQQTKSDSTNFLRQPSALNSPLEK